MTEIQKLFPALSLSKDGIWYGGASGSISYPENAYDDYFGLEEHSYWFRHRNNCINALIEAFQPANERTIFDIGGGNGFVSAALLQKGYKVILIEPGLRAAQNAKSRGVQDVICSTLEMTGGGAGSISNAGLFDVLEHVENDGSFLSTIAKMMKPGGRLYLTVPALPFLWSQEDAQAGHFRRYRKKNLLAKLRSAGFSVVYSSSFFCLMPLPILLFRTIPTILGTYRSGLNVTRNNHTLREGSFQRILARLFESEVEMIRKNISISVGGSYIVAAEVEQDGRNFLISV